MQHLKRDVASASAAHLFHGRLIFRPPSIGESRRVDVDASGGEEGFNFPRHTAAPIHDRPKDVEQQSLDHEFLPIAFSRSGPDAAGNSFLQGGANPPPAVGGAVLSAMLLAFGNKPVSRWDDDSLHQLFRVQQAVLAYRRRDLDLSDDVAGDAARLLDKAGSGDLLSKWVSGSTVHTSAVDVEGLGCAITASSGYGSGEMPAGTGLWLNNCLGELELNRRGLLAEPVGGRLPSNMAPSVACRKGRVLAIGSPGADRITTAMHQFLVNTLQLGMSLDDAVAHPRVHLDTSGETDRLLHEAGLPMPDTDMSVQTYDELSMYFGGVAAASYSQEHGFEVAADPRREGGVCVCQE